jgi:hypothetical protein
VNRFKDSLSLELYVGENQEDIKRNKKKENSKEIAATVCLPKRMEEDGPSTGGPFGITKALLLKRISLVVGRGDAPRACDCARFDLTLSS